MTIAAALTEFIRQLRAALLAPYVILLRVITGRWWPDYARIAELELACGLREPTFTERFIEQFDEPLLSGSAMTYRNVEASAAHWRAVSGQAAGIAARPAPVILGSDWEFRQALGEHAERVIAATPEAVALVQTRMDLERGADWIERHGGRDAR